MRAGIRFFNSLSSIHIRISGTLDYSFFLASTQMHTPYVPNIRYFPSKAVFFSLGSKRSGADKAIGTPHSSSYFISIRSESDGCDRRDYYLMNPLKDNYSNEGYNWSDDDYERLPSPGRTTQHSKSIVCREDTKAALSAVRHFPSAAEKTRGRCYFRYELRRTGGNNRGHVWFKLALHSNIQRGVPSARSRMERGSWW